MSPSNEHPGLISFRWTGWISLQSKGLSRVFSNTTVQKHQFLRLSAYFIVQLSHSYMTTGKIIALTRWTFVGKAMSLLFNMLSRLVINFLPRSKHLLISWLKSPFAVILEPKKIVCHCFYCFPIYLPWSDGTRCHDLCFLNVEFFFPFIFIFISWRLITLDYCSGFVAPKIKSFIIFPSICHEMMRPDAMILVFWILSFKPTFYSLSLSSEAL